MQVKVKLMGMLRSKFPGGATTLDMPEATTLAAVLGKLGVSSGQVHLALVNGTMEPERGRLLADGDDLVLFPPVAGGCETARDNRG